MKSKVLQLISCWPKWGSKDNADADFWSMWIYLLCMIKLYKREIEIIFSMPLTNTKTQPVVFHKSNCCLLLSVTVINRPENGKM